MDSKEIRTAFLNFFKERGHIVVPSSSLLPDDPSVLLTTAGMQQFKPYFLGKADPMKDFGAKRAASVQKAFRTSDIDEVGDASHLTFFEMLGHFSFGDYFKKETIEWTFEILTRVFEISKERISATVFEGDDKIPFDEESYAAWKKFLPEEKIRRGPRGDNVWGPAGAEGPCGAANEVYVDGLEAATLVFMEYYCGADSTLTPLSQKGVDVGWGLERVAMIVQKKNHIFKTDLFAPFMALLPDTISERQKRIIIDHLRGSVFLLADGVHPSNKEAGYILRRLLRRAFVYEHIHSVPSHVYDAIIHDIAHEYGEFYPELMKNSVMIREHIGQEKEKFAKTLERGLRELESAKKKGEIGGEVAFLMYQTFGLPYEIIKELGEDHARMLTRESFDVEFKKHQEISRAGQEKKFGGHGLLLDTGELKAADEKELKIVTRLHTATHLLNAALRQVLGSDIQQQGSDITVERTRFDFTYSRKLTAGEIKKIESMVNDVIRQDFLVEWKEMPYEKAIETGAIHFWREKYPPNVKVYSITHPETGEIFSRELCGGPHVAHTGETGHFRIVKEESSSAGVRRIRAVVE